jgi:hypothetical protein
MMKKAKQCIPILALVVLTALVQSGFCQNTFPSSGSVGIGTTTPSSMLTIRPTGANAFEIRPSSSTTSVTGEIRMLELAANGTNYVGFKAPSLISTNQIWVLPSTAGSSGQVLARSTGSDLVWSTVPATSLNNLTTTSINVDLIPSTSAVRNLGSSTLRWNLGYFSGGVVVGNTTVSTAGMIRYNAGTFQGFNGSSWLNLSGGSSGANTSLSNLTTTAINVNLNPSGTRTLGDSSNPWAEIWSNKLLSGTVNVAVWNATTRNFAAGGGRISSGTTLNNNIHIGFNAGGLSSPSEFDNFDNVIVGTSSGSSITSGFNNVLMGSSAGGNLTSGGGNTLIGHQSGVSVGTGSDNTLVGNVCGLGLGNGSNNSFLGRSAGTNITEGNSNVCIGAYTTAGTIGYAATGLTLVGANAQTSGSWNNATAIGNGASVAASNRVRLGNTAITRISGQVGFSIDSDRRLKQNIKNYELGLDFINKLRPVSYEYITNPEGGNRQGFIAQEVEDALGNLPFEGLCKPEHEADFYAINYAAFVVPLVNSVQVLSKQNDELKKNNEALNQTLTNLNEQIDELKSQMKQFDLSLAQCCNAYQPSNVQGTSSIDVPALEQNAPNPFSEHTIIRYYMPLQAQSASIKIYALDGSELLSIPATTKGVGSVTVNGHSLASGVYVYTLIIDGKTIDTKQMILTKQ